jgi:hypothetical protein
MVPIYLVQFLIQITVSTGKMIEVCLINRNAEIINIQDVLIISQITYASMFSYQDNNLTTSQLEAFKKNLTLTCPTIDGKIERVLDTAFK